MAQYKVCPDCGTNLDPQERCECGTHGAGAAEKKKPAADMEAMAKMILGLQRKEPPIAVDGGNNG